MKMNQVLAVVTALLVSGSAAAAVPHTAFQKWEQNRDKVLCTDFARQYHDAVAFRLNKNIPVSAENLAARGQSLCHAGKYVSGDADLSNAIARLNLIPTGMDIDLAD